MAKKKTLRGRFDPSRAAERAFFKQLKRVAQVAGHIVDQHVDGVEIPNKARLREEIRLYSEKIGPWAARQSRQLLESVSNSNKRAYRNKSKLINQFLNLGVAESEVGMVASSLLFEQVDLIKSIPLEAGLRAQEIALQAVREGTRATPDSRTIQELIKKMGMSTEAATNRAMLISRTETARANAAINEARARSVGSDQYRWHNSGDGAVRDSHKFYKGKRLQGMIFSWDSPPTLDDGMTGHPGSFPNCRCFAEPVFSDEILG